MPRIQLRKFILLVIDVGLLFLSLYLTLLLRYGHVTSDLWLRHVAPFVILFAIWITVFFINNLYAAQLAGNDYRFYGYLLQNLIINALIGFTFFYLAPSTLTSLKPFRVLIMLLLIFAILFLIWRKLFYLLTSSKKLTNRLLIIGLHPEALKLAQEIRSNPQYGYTLALLINVDQTPLPDDLIDIPTIKELTNLTFNIKAYGIQTVVTASAKHGPEVARCLFEAMNLRLTFYSFPVFYENLTGKLPVAVLEKNWFLEHFTGGERRLYEFAKRAQDIIFSSIFGLVSLIIVPFIVLAIKFDSRGPLLFKQTRTGKGGKTFNAVKFRSMVQGAETNGPQWATKHDARVTRIGRLLRRTRLDEIPQFVNILKGDMSFVGPRPERPEFVSLLSSKIPFYKERLLVKPGLTGWAQINFKYGDSIDDAMTKLQYDLFYIKNRSLILDISIVLKTFNTVLNAALGQ